MGLELTYTLKGKGNGVYAFLLDGELSINDIVLDTRDGAGFTNVSELKIKANLPSELLLMEVPMLQ